MSDSNDYLSVMDPEFLQTLTNSPMPPRPQQPDHTTRRRQLSEMVNMINVRDKALIPPDSDYRVEEHKVPVDGGEITVRCVIPTPGRGRSNSFPLLVHYHGGGWMSGDLELDDIWLKQVCVEQQISIVNVEYRLAPEYPYPTQQEDSYAALKWAVENTVLLRTFPRKGFITSGTSAGANIVAGLALRARDDPFFDARPLTGQILQAPCVVHPENIPDRYKVELRSMDMPLDPAFLNKSSVQWVLELWKPDPTDDITFPLLHPDHANLPPAVVQICDIDPLRDEGLLYGKLLKDAGNKTRLHFYAGVPHGFFFTHPQIKKSKQFMQNLKDGIRWLLEGAPDA